MQNLTILQDYLRSPSIFSSSPGLFSLKFFKELSNQINFHPKCKIWLQQHIASWWICRFISKHIVTVILLLHSVLTSTLIYCKELTQVPFEQVQIIWFNRKLCLSWDQIWFIHNEDLKDYCWRSTGYKRRKRTGFFDLLCSVAIFTFYISNVHWWVGV